MFGALTLQTKDGINQPKERTDNRQQRGVMDCTMLLSRSVSIFPCVLRPLGLLVSVSSLSDLKQKYKVEFKWES